MTSGRPLGRTERWSVMLGISGYLGMLGLGGMTGMNDLMTGMTGIDWIWEVIGGFILILSPSTRIFSKLGFDLTVDDG